MSYIHWGLTFNSAAYFIITSIFPLSTYFTAEVLGEKRNIKNVKSTNTRGKTR